MERKCILVSKALWNVKVEKKIRAPKHPVRRFIRFRHRLGEPDIALMTQWNCIVFQFSTVNPPLLLLASFQSLELFFVPWLERILHTSQVRSKPWWTKPNTDVCWVNRAIKGNFCCLHCTFAEGAWSQVPKTCRTFGIFWRHHFLLVHHENLPPSLFNLNLPYCSF